MLDRTKTTAFLAVALLGSLAFWSLSSAGHLAWGRLADDEAAGADKETQRVAIVKLADEMLASWDRSNRLREQLAAQHESNARAMAAMQAMNESQERAQRAQEEYRGKTLPIELSKAKGNLALAHSEQELAQDYFDWMKRMHEKGYRSKAEFTAAELELEQAKFELEAATSALAILEKHPTPPGADKLADDVQEFGKAIASYQVEKEREALLEKQLQRELFSPTEAQALSLLGQATELHAQNRLDDAQKRLDQAAKLWRSQAPARAQRELVQTQRRLEDALRKARQDKNSLKR